MLKDEIKKIEDFFNIADNGYVEKDVLYFFVSIRKILDEFDKFVDFTEQEFEEKKDKPRYNFFISACPDWSNEIFNIFDTSIKDKQLQCDVKFLTDCCFHIEKSRSTSKDAAFINLIKEVNQAIYPKIERDIILRRLSLYWSIRINHLFLFCKIIGIKNTEMINKNRFFDVYLNLIKNLIISLEYKVIDKKSNQDIIGFCYGDSWEYACGNKSREPICFSFINKIGDRYEL